jgi:hypothetical protein
MNKDTSMSTHDEPKRRIAAVPTGTAADTPAPQPTGKTAKLKAFLRSKPFLIGAPVALVGLVAVGVFVEPVKFGVLNIVGESKATFTIVDDETKTPVENASITVEGKTAKTNKQGKATIDNLPYGTVEYSIKKEAYDTVKASAKLASGDVKVGAIRFHSQGIPLTIKATQTLNGKVLAGFTAKVKDTDLSAQANKQGVAVIKVPTSKLGKLTLTLSANGFNNRSQEVTVTEGTANNVSATLTKSGKQYFLSNRDGTVGVYGANLDGTEQEVIIAGTPASKNDRASLSVSPNNKFAALLSERDNTKDNRGQKAPALFIINLEQKSIRRVDEGTPDMRIEQWVNEELLAYTISYNDQYRADSSKLKTVNAASYQLTTVGSYWGYANIVMFPIAPTKAYVKTRPGPLPYQFTEHLLAVDVLTKKSEKLAEIQNIQFMTMPNPQTIRYKGDVTDRQVGLKTEYYDVTVGNGTMKTSTTAPEQYDWNTYTPSPNGQQLIWAEMRDNTPVLFVGDKNGENGKVIPTAITTGLIVRWVDTDTLVAMSNDHKQPGLYTIDIATGKTTKISAVYSSY